MELTFELPGQVSENCDEVMLVLDVHSNEDEYRKWLETRQAGIGGSDAAAALGLSPWMSQRALFYDKTEPVVIKEDIELFEAGRRSEDMNARWFEDKIACRVVHAPFMVRSKRHPFMLADPDRYVLVDDTEEWGIIECKNVRASNIHEWDDGPPLHYRLQLQHYLAVTGLALGFFSVLVGGNKHLIFEVPRDDALIESMIAGEEAFWTCVTLGRPPEVDGSESTTEALAAHYPEVEVETVEVDRSFHDLVLRHRALKMQAKITDDQLTEVENRMKDQIGEAEAAVYKGETLATWKVQVRAAHEVKESKFRKLNVSKIKESK